MCCTHSRRCPSVFPPRTASQIVVIGVRLPPDGLRASFAAALGTGSLSAPRERRVPW